MRNVLNLGIFEYGIKAKWSTFFAALCFIMVLMAPSIALAVAAAGGGGGAQISGTNVNGTRNGPEVTWHAINRRRVGGRTHGANTHRTNAMVIRVEARRGGVTIPLIGHKSATLQAGRTGQTPVQPGCSINWSHQWRAVIMRSGSVPWTGSASLVRAH